MTLKEFYASLGVEYTEVLDRLRREDRIAKYLHQFAGDPAFAQLERAMEAGDAGEAFRAAHTIKGMCLNLSLGTLSQAACALVEALRAQDETAARDAYQELAARFIRVRGQLDSLETSEK